MLNSRWLRGFLFPSNSKAKRHSRISRSRPMLEALEERAVPASNYLVNVAGDAGVGAGLEGDIRYVITQANADPDSTITFDTAATGPVIVLSNNQLDITANMTITGPGAGTLTITGTSGMDASRVFDVAGGITVGISGLTITGGNASATTSATPGTQGGNIFNAGSLTLTNMVVTGGLAQGSVAAGGGIYNDSGATLIISGTTISNNTARGDDGADGVGSGSNGAPGGSGEGGGIFNDTGATLTIQNSSIFNGNQALGGAGGNGSAATVPGNSGGAGAVGGAASGGAIVNNGTLAITSATFSSNQAQGGAGGSGGNGADGMLAVVGNGGNGGTGGQGAGGGSATGGAISHTDASALIITGTSFSNNAAISGNSGNGGNGGNGGDTSDAGFFGGSAGSGGSGGNSSLAQGGALFSSGGDVSITGGTIELNVASSGSGGNGGHGGNGGSGSGGDGNGGTGGLGGFANGAIGGGISTTNSSLTITDAVIQQNQAVGGTGGSGGNGGNGHHGGSGGGSGNFGGSAWGGGVSTSQDAVHLTFINTPITNNLAISGAGGHGGNGGDGNSTSGTGGVGGQGRRAGTSWGGGVSYRGDNGPNHMANHDIILTNSPLNNNSVVSAAGGNGGNGGSGNVGGSGGSGGSSSSSWGGGIAIYDDNGPTTLTMTNSPVTGNSIQTTTGGQGGNGGFGTTTGGNGGSGGSAGSTWGGGILHLYAFSTNLIDSPVSDNSATGGIGGNGGTGGGAGAGGTGGFGGNGGSGNATWGGGLSTYFEQFNAMSGTSNVTNSPITNNVATSASGGNGGAGGSTVSGGIGRQGGSGGNAGSTWGGGVSTLRSTGTQSVIYDSSPISNNILQSGNGGQGGDGGTGGTGGNGGNGGRVNSSWGGGIVSTRINHSFIASPISNNQNLGGIAGNGGTGGIGTSAGGGIGGNGGAGNAAYGGGLAGWSSSAGSTFEFLGSDVLNNSLIGHTAGNGGTGGAGATTGGNGGQGGTSGTANGGGIYSDQIALSITNSAVAGNSASAANGGNGGQGGDGTAGNGGNGGIGGIGGNVRGGALFVNSADLTIVNSTIGGPTLGNSATAGNGGAGGNAGSSGAGGADGGSGGAGGGSEGGAVYASNVTAQITNATIASNEASAGSGGAGGLASGMGSPGANGIGGSATGGGYFDSGSTNNIGNSIVALNSASTDPDVSGTFASQGHNIIGEVGSATGFVMSDQLGVTPAQLNLGPLQNNGGNTLTAAPLTGSVAIDAGDNALLGMITTDQRGTGFNRIINTIVDVGAYEFQATTTVVITSGTPSNFGHPVTFTATVTSTDPGSNPIEGTVTFFDGITPIGAPVPLVGGVAEITISTLTIGLHTITAEYNGTANTSSDTVDQDVLSAATTTTVMTSGSPSNFGQAVTFTATVAYVNPNPIPLTGSVQFLDGMTPLGAPVPLVGGVAELTISTLTVGMHTITAQYTGSAEPSSGNVNQDVLSLATGTVVVSSVNPSTFGQSVTFTATVSYLSPNPTPLTGSVQFLDGMTPLGAPVPLVGGVAELTISTLTVGMHTITAQYTGSADPSSGIVVQNVNAIPPSSSNIIAVGADAGAAPQVNIYEAGTGDLLTSFFAFDVGFLGGVRVAVADVNNDNVPDVIVGAGEGGNTHVKVFDGATQSLLYSFFAFPGFNGDVFVAAGDVNNDGHADIITGAGLNGPGGHVKVFSGADGSEIYSFFAFGAGFLGGARVASGDTNNDGFDDIIVGAGPGAGPHVIVFSGENLAQLQSFYAFDETFLGGVYVAAGDINDDGDADIIVGAGAAIGPGLPNTGPFVPGDPRSGPNVRAFDGIDLTLITSFFAYDPAFFGGVRVGSTDWDGDGVADILTGPGSGIPSNVRVFNSDATLLDEFFAFDPGFLGGVFVGG